MKKRVLTTLLALCVMFTSIPVDMNLHAQEIQSETSTEEPVNGTGNGGDADMQDAGTTDASEVTDGEGNSKDADSAVMDEGSENSEATGSTEAMANTESINPTESNNDTGMIEDTETAGNTEQTGDTEAAGNTEQTGDTEAAEDMEQPGSTKLPENTPTSGTESSNTNDAIEGIESVEGTESTEEEAKEQAELNFVMVESEYLQTPATQNIVASLGTADMELSDIRVNYQNLTTGEVHSAPATAKEEDMVLFSSDYTDESQTGVYQLTSLSYVADGKEYQIDLLALDMDVRYGVNMDAEATPDQMIKDAETIEAEQAQIDASIVTMDEKGSVISENTVEDVLGAGAAELSRNTDIKGANGNLVVMLDPGHDATHSGAWQNGAKEELLVLKIALYCKEELETYSGVTVYMTRGADGTCPYGGSSVTSGTCNESRVAYASAVGANVYISFHLNSNVSSAPNGVGVYYPNSNYNAQIGEIGKGLAAKILEKLKALGISQWGTGIIVWNATYDKYPDGSTADYLGVIRNCKKVGIPAVLIEHAFISNTSDYTNFLNSDEKLKNLGVADATAIAEAYGLQKKTNKPTIEYTRSLETGSLNIKWAAMSGASYYELYRSTQKDTNYKQVAEVKGATTYVDDTVTVGKKYYYKVRAVYTNGTVSEMSEPFAGRVLATVSMNYAKSVASKKIELSWNKVTGANGYYIYRAGGDSASYQQIAKISSNKTLSYIDKVSANNKSYSYQVCAYSVVNNVEGVGAKSDARSTKALGTPKISSVLPVSAKVMEIEWNKIKGASGYEIARSTKADGSYKVIATIESGSTTNYQDSTVKAEKMYYYKVRAINSGDGATGESAYSKVVSGKTIACAAIKSVIAQSDTVLEIKWEKVSDAYGYKVKRSTSKNGTYKTIKTIKKPTTTSYKDKKVTVGTTYYYKIETLTKSGDKIGSSGESAAVKGKTVARPNISYVSSVSNKQLQIGWNEVSGAWGYNVKRSTSKNGTYKTIATVQGASTTTYKDKSLTTGKKYYYKVEAINKVNGKKGYSGDSDAVAGKTIAKVTLTAMKAVNSNTISLSWKKVSGVSGYEIYRSTSKSGKYELVGRVSGAKTTSYEDTTVKAGKNYYYKVRGYKKNSAKEGKGTYSDVQKAWTVKKVEITKTSGTSGNSVKLTWDKVSKASGYRIYRSTKENSGYKLLKEIKSASTVTYKDTTVKTGKVYYYQIVAINKIKGDEIGQGDYSDTLRVPVLKTVEWNSITLQDDNTFLMQWNSVKNADGYELAIAYKEDGEYQTLAKLPGTSCIQDKLTAGQTYYYKVRAYANLTNGKTVYGEWSKVQSKTAAYEIMGESAITVEQMVAYYSSKYQYPAAVYTEKGAATATDFFTILKEEADAEGVKAEVLYAQVLLETGGLQFGGDVNAAQCNFGGIGATGNGVAGETFADVRTGLRAQTQHLKAYACTDGLNQTCVDTRFQYVSRGCAPYVEWLSIPQNPSGKGWATDPAYGTKLLAIIKAVKNI